MEQQIMQAARTEAVSGIDVLRGLTESEATQRRAQGQGNNVTIQTGRTYGEILYQNFFTFINVVLFIIGFMMLALGLTGDAVVSVGVIALNLIVNVVQEFRAKAKLDQIALLTRPKAMVLRDGQEKTVDPSEVVLGDILIVRPGDQIVVDGSIIGDGRMDVDESLLTGESDLVPKMNGAEVLSGSFCVTGSASFVAEKVGKDSYINKLTASAKAHRIIRTPLQKDINFVVRILLLMAAMIGLLFAGSFAIRHVSTVQTVQTAAVIAGLVPAGLVLMTTTAYAMGSLRMAGKGALIQQSNAVESMSNVNVLCLDKTGTLTANRINLNEVYTLMETEEAFRAALGDYACSTRAGNRTSDALGVGCEGQKRQVVDEIPFSSARKWSAISFDDPNRQGVYVLGAPEMLMHYIPDDADIQQEQINAWTEKGLRVLVMLYHPMALPLHDVDDNPMLPEGLQPLGLVSFSDELREEAKETLEGFINAGIRPKIISGDNPHTVAALARQAGLPPDVKVVSGPELALMDEGQIDKVVDEATIFGRITPEQKEMLVDSLRRKGNYVAMIGDGVNDVLSLKKAHIGIAMQSGSAATRGVADIVLLNDSFAVLPKAFMEGQRILNGMQDIIRLFLTRAFYAALIILGAAVVAEAQFFPFVPKHASLITLVTVGFPTLALAAWARPGVPKGNMRQSLMHFVFPAAGTLAFAALSVYCYYLYIHYYIPDMLTYAEQAKAVSISRTALTTSVIFMGLLLIPFVEPPTRLWVGGDELSGDWRPSIMAVLMFVLYVIILVHKPFRLFWELESLKFEDYLFLSVIAVTWAMALRYIWRFDLFERFLGIDVNER